MDDSHRHFLRSHSIQSEASARGVARIIITNHEYLGIHNALNTDIPLLSHPRIIDFSGELFAHRKDTRDGSILMDDDEGRILVGKSWFADCIREPMPKSGSSTSCEKPNQLSNDHIVELASLLPIEPYFHTTYINELICCPIKIHGLSPAPTFLKIELVRMKWDEALCKHVVLKLSSEPLIHNPRWGSPLVEEYFTSCVQGSPLLDEFKVKLPSALMDCNSGAISLLVTAYIVRKRSDTYRSAPLTSKFLRGRRGNRDSNDQTKRDYDFEFMGCGLLALTAIDDDVSVLLMNGLHEIELNYWLRPVHEISNDLSNTAWTSNYGPSSEETAFLVLENIKEHSPAAKSFSSQQSTKGYPSMETALVVEVRAYSLAGEDQILSLY